MVVLYHKMLNMSLGIKYFRNICLKYPKMMLKQLVILSEDLILNAGPSQCAMMLCFSEKCTKCVPLFSCFEVIIGHYWATYGHIKIDTHSKVQ